MANFWIPSKRHRCLPCRFSLYLWWFISWIILQYHQKGSHLWIFMIFLSCVALPQLLFGFMLWGQHKQQVSASTDWFARLQLLSDRLSSADKRLWPKQGALPISHGLPRAWKTSENQPVNKTRACFSLLPLSCADWCVWQTSVGGGARGEDSKLKARCGCRCQGIAIKVISVQKIISHSHDGVIFIDLLFYVILIVPKVAVNLRIWMQFGALATIYILPGFRTPNSEF